MNIYTITIGNVSFGFSYTALEVGTLFPSCISNFFELQVILAVLDQRYIINPTNLVPVLDLVNGHF
jgi:hypothetical protein